MGIIQIDADKGEFKTLQSLDFYSLDAAFLSGNLSSPQLNLKESRDLSSSTIAFLFLRGLLHRAVTGKKLEILELTQELKKKFVRLGLGRAFQDIFVGSFLPFNQKEDEAVPEFLKNKEGYFFLYNQNGLEISGGRIGKSGKNIGLIIEDLFNTYNLSKATGEMYFRTSKKSYLYLLRPEYKEKFFYIQEKEFPEKDIEFFFIKLKKVSV